MKRRTTIKNMGRGFALVASLMLMLLLGILALGMLSLSSISLRSESRASAINEARANARMALILAIGQLQTSLGPDQRISARAKTLAKHPAFGGSTDVEGAKAWWVGAASSDKTKMIGPNKQPVLWLISGLDETVSSADQITDSSPFKKEVILYSDKSIDLRLTGGEPIKAGMVDVQDRRGNIHGSYAYFIDDNGMKAQLGASDPRLINNDNAVTRVGGTILPGSYNLGILDGMDDLVDTPVGEYSKMHSINDLSLLGAKRNLPKDKRLSYTNQSLGVLSDVKKGGLKKDLTAAFENYSTDSTKADHPSGGSYPNWPVYTVFDKEFKKKSNSEWGNYLAVDDSKQGEFGENGYIHWAIFRDYYNLKRYIRRQNGVNEEGTVEAMDYLDPITFEGPTSISGGIRDYAKGILAPHNIGPDSSDPTLRPPSGMENMPYGNFRTTPNYGLIHNKEFMQYYKHSPITLVLSRVQTNAWVEQGVIDRGRNNQADLTNIVDALRTRVQTFTTHYNPYNITIRCYGDNHNIEIMGGTPTVKIGFNDGVIPFAPDMYYNASNGPFVFSGTNLSRRPPYEIITANPSSFEGRRYYASGDLMIGPGRSRIAGFGKDVQGGGSGGSSTYTLNIANNLDKSAYIDYNIESQLPTTFDIFGLFAATQAMGHGVLDKRPQHATQWMWVPFAKQDKNLGSPEIRVDAPGSGLGVNNSRVGLSLELRTTTDENDSIRALVDSNIRGFYINPRWDSPLISEAEPLHTAAAYKVTKLEELNQSQAPQMDFTKDSKGNFIGGLGYWGASHDSFGNSRVILFDIPRQDLVSLGQLQHAGAGRFSYEPSYIVGNSYANPRIPLSDWKTTFTDTFSTTRSGVAPTLGQITLYDASYLVNETLWDSYIFTTIPQNADNYLDPDDPEPNERHFENLLSRDAFLPNPRFIPYEPGGSSFDRVTLQAIGDDDNLSSFHYNAGHLLVDGAFNVNSTSIDAWEAFLSGTHSMPYVKLDDTGKPVAGYDAVDDAIRFPRVQTVFGESFEKEPANEEENTIEEGYWTGFRALTPIEVRALASEIVDQVIDRGPFLSLAEFVNRKLEDGKQGEKGAIQAALDKTVNAGAISGYEAQTTHSKLPARENQAAGFSGQILQGDLLQALSPLMTVRSDTFIIRAYGEALNPNTGDIAAKAWCEASVQRYPDPVEPDPDNPFLNELALPSNPHGREFRITRFRWLSAGEI